MATGDVIQGVRWLRDAAGRLVGYRNPLTDKDEEVNMTAVAALVSDAGKSNSRSILVVGGDHPYTQWWGTNGRDGLAQMYLDAGIKAYCAICADESSDSTSGNGATLGKLNMMKAEQAQELQARGVEFISHGTRHTHFWELFNTGIRVYYTGAEATPTVNISATQLTTSTATTGATAFLFSTSTTLAALAAAINALAGWNCLLATELLGTEPSAQLVPLRAARSVTFIGAGDPTNSNQRFALCAGIMIRYNGTAYREVTVQCNAGSNFLSVFCDGARVIATTTAATLQTISNAINALNIAGLTSLVMDNGYGAQTIAGSTALNQGQKSRETYCLGDEDGAALLRIDNARSVNGYGVMVTAGVGMGYVMQRAIAAVKERAASIYGVNINSFAQSGGRLHNWMVAGVQDEHVGWRGDRSMVSSLNAGLSPHAMPANLPTKFSGHFTSIVSSSAITPYTEADVKAVIDALGDSDGWVVNWLNHLCTPTPGDPSPYTGLNQHSSAFYLSSADQDEGPYYREVQYAAAARDAGLIDILPPTEAEHRRVLRRPPSNLIFNPKFRNGLSDNLLGVTSTALGQGGIKCPGVFLVTSASDFSAVTVSADRAVTLTTVGALAANKTPLAWNLFLEPGKTYQIGAQLNLSAWGALNTNSARFVLYPLANAFGAPYPVGTTSFSSETFFGGRGHDALFRLTVPSRTGPTPARVISLPGPFAFTAGDSITIQIDNRAASAPIVLTGLTSARQVAAVINAAIDADATYSPLGQYTRVARVEDNRVVIEAPNVANLEDLSLLSVANSAGTPLVTLFGAGVTACRATSKLSGPVDMPIFGFKLALLLSSTSGIQTMKLKAPYCREILL